MWYNIIKIREGNPPNQEGSVYMKVYLVRQYSNFSGWGCVRGIFDTFEHAKDSIRTEVDEWASEYYNGKYLQSQLEDFEKFGHIDGCVDIEEYEVQTGE